MTRDIAFEHDRRAVRALTFERLGRGLAHDLRGPLNVIALNAELLRRISGEGEQNATRLGIVTQELARLKRGLDLVLAQLAGGDGGDAQRFDARDVLGEVVLWIAPAARQAQIVFDPDPGERALGTFGHPALVREALLALGAALVASLPDGSQIALRADAAQGATSSGGMHVITLRAAHGESAAPPAAHDAALEDDPAFPVARTLLARDGARLEFDPGPVIRVLLSCQEPDPCRTPSSSTTTPTR